MARGMWGQPGDLSNGQANVLDLPLRVLGSTGDVEKRWEETGEGLFSRRRARSTTKATAEAQGC